MVALHFRLLCDTKIHRTSEKYIIKDMDMKKTNRRRSVILVFLVVFGLGLLEARGEVAQPQTSGRGFSLKLSGGMGFFLDGG
jgi:hypothetical protein